MTHIPDPTTGQPVPPWHQGKGGTATAFTRSEAQRFARQLVQSETYRQSLEDRIKTKDLPPAVECMLWYYAYGKPTEHVNLNVTPGQEDLSTLSIDQLQEKMRNLSEQLEEAKALQDAIPADVVKGPW